MKLHVISDQWNFIDKTKFKILRRLPSISDEKRSALVSFYESVGPQLRGDYAEAAELALILLGAGKNVSVKKPSSDSHARWMSKILYAAKDYMFAPQLNVFDASEVKRLQDFLHFAVFVYLPAWFKVPFITEAAITDIAFAKGLHWFAKFQPEVSRQILVKMNNHSWYLGQELAWTCIFSKSLSDEERQKVIHKLTESEPIWEKRGIKLHGNQGLVTRNSTIVDIKSLTLESLVDGRSRAVMQRFGVTYEWQDEMEFERQVKIVESIPCTNDICERAIHLANSHQEHGPRTENARQDFYLVADEARKIPRQSLTALNEYYASR